MIDMDRQKAFAVLGLPDDASREEIEALVGERRRKLRQRIVFATTAEQRESSERALSELETAHAVATMAPSDPDGSPPSGVAIDFPKGKTLGDRYVIRRRIGYGENGAVFAALDLSWGKEIALKIYRPELLLVPGTFERLRDAVQSVFELAHSGIVSVYGLERVDGHVIQPMELLPKRTLRSLVQDIPPAKPGVGRSGLSLSQVVDAIQTIVEALDYARSRTLHLNLKPDNVIVSDDGFLKLTDFGLDPILGPALQVTSPTAREQRRYRAPEVARQSETGSTGSTPIDERADQFSVAAIAHYLLLATAPYPDPSPMALRHRGLTKPLAEVMSRGLSSEPRERFATVSEFAHAFKKAAEQKVSRRVLATTTGISALLIMAVFSVAVVGDRNGALSRLAAPVLNLIPGWEQPMPAAGQAALDRQDRVLELSRALIGHQNALRRDFFESRITVRAAAQALDLAETDEQFEAAETAFQQAEEAFQRLMALRDIANPEIFNSPETLNAVNLIGLASDQLTEGRYDAADTTLRRAEDVLAAKLKDYDQAVAIVGRRFLSDDQKAPAGDSQAAETDDLRRDWLQAAQSRRRFAAEVRKTMVVIPGGTFQMGDVAGIGNQTEQPVRLVLVPSFQLSAFEVTRDDYALCVADDACATPDVLPAGDPGEGALPVTGISWYDAQAYVSWLSDKTGEEYRLPTEAEWEYAARSGLDVAYPWGASVGRGHANCVNCGSPWEGVGAAPVGSFAPNGLGLYDMAGNAWEWTEDCWVGDYRQAPAIAIAREGNALCAERTLRGGSWANDAWLARTTYRGRGRADVRQDLNGFRVARSVD